MIAREGEQLLLSREMMTQTHNRGEQRMLTPTHVLVTGVGGFIGYHLATFLKRQGYWG